MDGLSVEGYDGTTTSGWNITTSEMCHLFYTELGNLAEFDTSGNLQSGFGLTNTVYWSGGAPNASDYHWRFYFHSGKQDKWSKWWAHPAIAVRDGDVAAVAVPEPATVALLVIGLVGLAGAEIKRRRKKRAVGKVK